MICRSIQEKTKGQMKHIVTRFSEYFTCLWDSPDLSICLIFGTVLQIFILIGQKVYGFVVPVVACFNGKAVTRFVALIFLHYFFGVSTGQEPYAGS